MKTSNPIFKNGSPLRGFKRDLRGNVAMMFGLTFLPVFGLLSLSVDYGRAVSLKTQMQSAVDEAVLAGTSAANGADRATVAQTYFDAASHLRGGTVTSRTFAHNATTGVLTGTVNMSQPMMLGQNWGAAFNVGVTAKATVSSIKVRALDVVMCIDATGSMDNTLGAVQTNALNFKTNLDAAMVALGMPAADRTRVRVIYFRDFGGNGYRNITSTDSHGNITYPYGGPVSGTALGDSVPLLASGFYTLSADNNAYSTFVSGPSAGGGGDWPESGLECLNEAMRSSWSQVGDSLGDGKVAEVVYPIISIYTDAGSHPPSFPASLANPSYPSAAIMPRDYAGLLAKWNSSSIDQTNKKILFYGNPDKVDDTFYNLTSGWQTIKTWTGFSNPASLTSANVSFISTLANGIVGDHKTPTLTQ